MQLYLSSESPWNATYTDEDGNILYKAASPAKFNTRHIVIKTIRPASITTDPLYTSHPAEPVEQYDDVDDDDEEETNLGDSLMYLADIEYHPLRTSRIRYDDWDVSTSEFFNKSGYQLFGRYGRQIYIYWRCRSNSSRGRTHRNRTFTGPDGREYSWKMGTRACKVSNYF